MYDHRFVAAGAVAILVTLVAIFSLRPLARRIGLVDKPNARKRHRGRIPLIGGLCFFLGTIAGLAYFGYLDRFVVCLIAMSALIFVAGLVDDIGELSVRSRLLIQTGTAGLMIALSGVYVTSGGVLFGGQELRLGALGIPLTIVAVVGLVNAFNMLDGIDGLAGGLALTSIAAALTFAGSGWSTLGVALLLQILAVTLIAYLGVNMGWPDGRKIFMGDAGSTLIGFMLAWSLIYMSQGEAPLLAPVDVLWCVALPVMDTFGVMWRRARAGLSPFVPDRRHLHHLLQDAGCSARESLLLILALGAGLAGLGYALRGLPDIVSLSAFAALLVAHVLWVPLATDALRRFAVRQAQPVALGTAASFIGVTGPDLHWPSRKPGAVRAGLEAPVTASASTSSGVIVKALCVLDASAESLKLGPIVQQLARDGRFQVEVCVITLPNQPSCRILKLFDIHPHHVLSVKAPERDLSDISSAPLRGMKRVLLDHEPDVVLVHGETLAALAGTLAAYFQKIPVACLKTGSAVLRNPVSRESDEAVRKITGTLASLHIAATETAGRELLAAGIPQERVRMAGAAASDAAPPVSVRVSRDHGEAPQAPAILVPQHALAQRFPFVRSGRPLLLMADGDQGDEEFIHLSEEMRTLALQRPDLDIVYPVAPSVPERRNSAAPRQPLPANLHEIEPLDPAAFQYLLAAAYLVLARTAEVQREAMLLNKPVLVLRGDRDGVAAARPDSTSPLAIGRHEIAECVTALLSDRNAYEAMCFASGPGSDSAVGMCIVEALVGLPQCASRAAA